MSLSARSSLASAAIGGSVVVTALGALLAAPLAHATPAPDPATCAGVLGVAGLYDEFVEGDARRGSGTEGAVAIGGNADFRGGFTVGRELTAGRVEELPGGNSLVVAGAITGTVRLVNGNGSYGGTLSGTAEAHHGTVAGAPSPIDFAAEFDALRKVSDALAAIAPSPSARWSPDGSTLELTGTDARFNAFAVPAAELERAGEIRLAVPAGAVTVINVKGASYDQAKAGATGFVLRDGADAANGVGGPDAANGSAAGPVGAKLLWNFPEATRVVKSGAGAWPGSVLAPGAAVDLGSGGPVDGSVIAESLTAAGGAGTRHHPFTGCLPGAPAPVGKPPAPRTSPTPAATPSATLPARGSIPATPTPGTLAGSRTPAPSGSAPAIVTRDASGLSGASGAAGGLALTGAGMAVPLAIGGALVLALGTGMVLFARRRGA